MVAGTLQFPDLPSITGLRLGTTAAGIRYENRRDLVIMELAEGSTVAGVFTNNAFCAAPVVIAKKHLSKMMPRYFVINTGNANAGMGAQGIEGALHCCQEVSRLLDCKVEQVLPFSTGVIGEALPVAAICQGLPSAIDAFIEDGWTDAAHGILTTDTLPKGATHQFEVDGQTVTVTGIAKGSGMIRPDMATMLAYVATDATVPAALLQQCLQVAVKQSFNRITVDGDTSTNDACMLVATGQSSAAIAENTVAYHDLENAVTAVCITLAQSIIRDGEGATKFVTVEVLTGKDADECDQVAYTVAHSPLVKTALFASDPNWGRILAAVGRAGVSDLVLDDVEIYLGDVCIVKNGGRAPGYTEAAGQAVMDQSDIMIQIHLHRGSATTQVWTSDLSFDYVKINAEYRT